MLTCTVYRRHFYLEEGDISTLVQHSVALHLFQGGRLSTIDWSVSHLARVFLRSAGMSVTTIFTSANEGEVDLFGSKECDRAQL